MIVGSFYRDTCSGSLLSLCCPPSLCLLLVPVAEVAEPDTCQLMQGSAALWCEQEWTAVPVAQGQTFSFAYGTGRKAGIHLWAQSEHMHKDLQLCEFSGTLHPVFSAQVLLHSWGLTDCSFCAELIPLGNFLL